MAQDQAQHADVEEPDLFEWGPPRGLPMLFRLPAPIFPHIAPRALVALAIGWLPLLLLVIVAPSHDLASDLRSFLRDVGVHARFAFAVPILLVAHIETARRLGTLVRHFATSGLVPPEHVARLEAEVVRARQLVRSPWAEAIVLLLSYSVIFALWATGLSDHGLAPWLTSDVHQPSAAGWWHLLISVPLLLTLLMGWLWRILIWTRLLHRIAGMQLRLVVAHPDNAGGLGFLAQAVRAFAFFGAGIGCITAGRFANVHLEGANTQLTDGFLIGGTVALVLALGVAPLFVFAPTMARAWRRNAMYYGALAVALGRSFESRWFDGPAEDQPDLLSAPDFSAAADLYGVVSNVYSMRFLPVDLRSLLILGLATLSPFVPAMFLSMPTMVVLQELKGLLV